MRNWCFGSVRWITEGHQLSCENNCISLQMFSLSMGTHITHTRIYWEHVGQAEFSQAFVLNSMINSMHEKLFDKPTNSLSRFSEVLNIHLCLHYWLWFPEITGA